MIINRTNQRSIVLLVIAGVVVLFFAVVGGLAFKLRKELRSQVINSDGEIFMVVASAEVDRVRSLNEGIFSPGADEELFEVAINTSEIKGVIGVRVFKEGNVSVGGIPIALKRGRLEPYEENVLKNQVPISRFHPEFVRSDIFLLWEDEADASISFPVLEIIIPLFSLQDEEVSGFAQYFIDGSDLEAELQAVDGNILTYAGGAFLLGSLLGGGILYWAFRKLRLVNELLEDRTRNLISANHKLSMEARTAAIGAITSHLIHGLKSPLQGIRQFVTAQSNGEADESANTVWRDAAESAERMQTLVNEVVEVLQDREGEFAYEITAPEIGSLVDERVLHYAEKKGVAFAIEEKGAIEKLSVSNERANLMVLILVNLVRNAIDASQEKGKVRLKMSLSESGSLVFDVEDFGGGLPREVLENLFQPVTSGKPDGSGIGLSLCQELTRHLEGELKLARTGPEGTVFQLIISKLP